MWRLTLIIDGKLVKEFVFGDYGDALVAQGSLNHAYETSKHHCVTIIQEIK